jgi:VanZ family protein
LKTHRGKHRVGIALWAVVGVILLVTIILSIGPNPPFDSDVIDRLEHGLDYAVLTAVLLLAAVWRPGYGHARFPNGAAVVLGLVFVLGGAIELAQGAWFTRTPDLLDLAANVLGSTAALTGWALLRHRWKARPGTSPTRPVHSPPDLLSPSPAFTEEALVPSRPTPR